jgi:hypothetical protein
MGSPDPPVPISIETLFEVIDLNQQTLKSSTSLVLHPCEYYVGILLEKPSAVVNETYIVEFVVSDRGNSTNVCIAVTHK